MRNASGHQCKVKVIGSEKKGNEKTYDRTNRQDVIENSVQKRVFSARGAAATNTSRLY